MEMITPENTLGQIAIQLGEVAPEQVVRTALLLLREGLTPELLLGGIVQLATQELDPIAAEGAHTATLAALGALPSLMAVFPAEDERRLEPMLAALLAVSVALHNRAHSGYVPAALGEAPEEMPTSASEVTAALLRDARTGQYEAAELEFLWLAQHEGPEIALRTLVSVAVEDLALGGAKVMLAAAAGPLRATITRFASTTQMEALLISITRAITHLPRDPRRYEKALLLLDLYRGGAPVPPPIIYQELLRNSGDDGIARTAQAMAAGATPESLVPALIATAAEVILRSDPMLYGVIGRVLPVTSAFGAIAMDRALPIRVRRVAILQAAGWIVEQRATARTQRLWVDEPPHLSPEESPAAPKSVGDAAQMLTELLAAGKGAQAAALLLYLPERYIADAMLHRALVLAAARLDRELTALEVDIPEALLSTAAALAAVKLAADKAEPMEAGNPSLVLAALARLLGTR
jgi:hypothetical protein